MSCSCTSSCKAAPLTWNHMFTPHRECTAQSTFGLQSQDLMRWAKAKLPRGADLLSEGLRVTAKAKVMCGHMCRGNKALFHCTGQFLEANYSLSRLGPGLIHGFSSQWFAYLTESYFPYSGLYKYQNGSHLT